MFSYVCPNIPQNPSAMVLRFLCLQGSCVRGLVLKHRGVWVWCRLLRGKNNQEALETLGLWLWRESTHLFSILLGLRRQAFKRLIMAQVKLAGFLLCPLTRPFPQLSTVWCSQGLSPDPVDVYAVLLNPEPVSYLYHCFSLVILFQILSYRTPKLINNLSISHSHSK